MMNNGWSVVTWVTVRLPDYGGARFNKGKTE